MMRISLINFTRIRDEVVQDVIRVINRQIREDFQPHWGIDASVRLEGKNSLRPRIQSPIDMRGDSVIYLSNSLDVGGVLGYHEANFLGIPYGFAFTWLSRQLGESWTVTLSHEVLEIIGDPQVNRLIAGPHPEHPMLQVFHWHEMCDAVQTETYEIDGVEVSNFLLPLYFTSRQERGSRNDFMGKLPALKSFGVKPGGYIGFFNPQTRSNETYEPDRQSQARARIKEKAGLARRSVRYRQLGTIA